MLNDNDIKHVAKLARLQLSDKEIKQYRREISGIVRYIDKLAEINLTKEEATTQLIIADNQLRLDAAINWSAEEKNLALAAAPKKKNKLIVVPRVFEL
ncbi:MAG: Asp-tRNA(Asn)/Glu-tRNA(Gln) amidotransferase subunit GatC [Candidatus Nanoarchaeia archaeon]|jgi:aspartyl-tRNA(Asn)/glutamyl-tRNA(Gln) amidotransferase subunit C